MPKSRNRGKRNTRRRRLAHADRLYGPDRADTIRHYQDGWTIRRLTRRQDLEREGHLLHTCLDEMTEEFTADPIPGAPLGFVHSLRDVDNHPHATFWWQVEPFDMAISFAGHGDTHPLRPHYAQRLQAWLITDGVPIGCAACPDATRHRPRGYCSCIGVEHPHVLEGPPPPATFADDARGTKGSGRTLEPPLA